LPATATRASAGPPRRGGCRAVGDETLLPDATSTPAPCLNGGRADRRDRSRSDQDCRLSSFCRERGQCTLVGDRCEARTDADCASADGCHDDGACKLIGGTCQAGDVEACRASRGCRERGRCKHVGYQCLANGERPASVE
jgi:hypothetical protein